MISWNKLIVLLVYSLSLNSAIQAQVVYYYQLTKTKINGIESTKNKGGQFICLYDDFCFDCDKNGKGVGNGQLLKKNKGEYIVYFGESYFGKNSYYKFNKNLSKLNIITPEGDIYAYKRVTAPSNVNTCSLIKVEKSKSKSNWNSPVNNYSGGSVPVNTYSGGYDNNNTNNNTINNALERGYINTYNTLLKNLEYWINDYNNFKNSSYYDPTSSMHTYRLYQSKSNIKDTKEEIRKLRKEAAKDGINIPMSSLENINVY